MKENNKSPLLVSIVIGIVIIAVLKNLVPAIAKLAVTLIIVAGIVLVILMAAIIVSSLKSGKEKDKNDDLPKTEKEKLDYARKLLTGLKLNAAKIDDIEIRNLFSSVIESIEKIIKAIKESPKEFQKARRVFNYYLESIKEIEDKYITLQDGNVDIDNTKEKLINSLNEIKLALNNLYDSLFEENKIDLVVDMKALSLALHRDGLISDNLDEIVDDLEKDYE